MSDTTQPKAAATNNAASFAAHLQLLKSIPNLPTETMLAPASLAFGLSSEAKVLGREGFISDFARQSAQLGDVYQLTNNGWWVWVGNITQFDPTIVLDASIVRRGLPTATATYTTQSGSSFTLGVSGTVTGLGKGDVKVDFTESNSLFAVFKNQVMYSLALGVLEPKLNKIWSDQHFNDHPKKYFVVSEIVAADSGTMLYSEKSGISVTLSCTANIPVNGLNLVADGNFSITAGSSMVENIISQTAIAPLFQAYRQRLWPYTGLWISM